LSGAADDEQLLLEQKVLSDYALDTTRTEQFRGSSQQMDK
jgi:hypothetical protein